ncbi:MAG TPA: DUF2652 domain-containing protein [Dehalococcoidia bacterium]|nr:DUF2652 domain-containing protein [Dehalococcoidia bacterium]
MATEGTFLLADIGGYTSFLSDVGIQHGKEITEHLLNRLIRTIPKRWKVANVMGDCVFFYAPQRASSEEASSAVRSLYQAFREARTEIAGGSTCRCGACDRSEDLSLKFVVHAGEYDTQKIGGRTELIGSEVVLATRLLKNSVPVREYVILTRGSVDVSAAIGEQPIVHGDELEGIGGVDYTYIDLQPLAREYERGHHFFLSDNDARLTVRCEIKARPDDVFDVMRDPKRRAQWQVTVEKMTHIQGESGHVGEVRSCVHGDGMKFVHLVLAVDEEGRRMTERMWMSPALMKDTIITSSVEPAGEERTEVVFRARFRPGIPLLSHLALPIFARLIKGEMWKDLAGLKEMCEGGKVRGREDVTLETTGD